MTLSLAFDSATLTESATRARPPLEETSRATMTGLKCSIAARARRHAVVALFGSLVMVGCGSNTLPTGMGAVIGGIIPCAGIVMPGGPHYAAGSVTVLKGQIASRPSSPPGTSVDVFPTEVVAHQSVPVNAQFHFVLPSGRYVLRAQFPPPANVHPFATVTVRSGATLSRDIPNMCM